MVRARPLALRAAKRTACASARNDRCGPDSARDERLGETDGAREHRERVCRAVRDDPEGEARPLDSTPIARRRPLI